MTYEETIELEENVAIKNKADILYRDFINHIKLSVDNHVGEGRFIVWKDEHNAMYVSIKNKDFVFECRFLHETYNVLVNPSGLFNAIKMKDRGVDHLQSHITSAKKSWPIPKKRTS